MVLSTFALHTCASCLAWEPSAHGTFLLLYLSSSILLYLSSTISFLSGLALYTSLCPITTAIRATCQTAPRLSSCVFKMPSSANTAATVLFICISKQVENMHAAQTKSCHNDTHKASNKIEHIGGCDRSRHLIACFLDYQKHSWL